MFFVAADNKGRELWTSDGSVEGTRSLDLNQGSFNSNPYDLTIVDNTIYLFTSLEDMWKSDGTDAGTIKIAELRSGANPQNLMSIDSTIYFSANGGSSYNLWQSDGTSNGTTEVIDPNNAFQSLPKGFTGVTGGLFFVTDKDTQGGIGKTVWVYR